MRQMGRRYEEDTRYFAEMNKYKKKCRCGHNVIILPPNKKKICKWCGYYVYADKKDEVFEKVKKIINGSYKGKTIKDD